MRGEGGRCGVSAMSTAVHRSPNKLWRSNSIFNLWCSRTILRFAPPRHAGSGSNPASSINNIDKKGLTTKNKHSGKSLKGLLLIVNYNKTLSLSLSSPSNGTLLYNLYRLYCTWPHIKYVLPNGYGSVCGYKNPEPETGDIIYHIYPHIYAFFSPKFLS